jgi:putative Appr-1-p processing enzyme family protein
MIKVVEGDILEAKEFFIVQQVNCQGVMGAGLAKAIYTKWPMVKREYLDYCKRVGPIDHLIGRVQYVYISDTQIIANCFSQRYYKKPEHRYDPRFGQFYCYTDYDAMENCFDYIATNVDKSIAIPYGIGCGLAGGDWTEVEYLIKKCFRNNDVTIYKLPTQ